MLSDRLAGTPMCAAEAVAPSGVTCSTDLPIRERHAGGAGPLRVVGQERGDLVLERDLQECEGEADRLAFESGPVAGDVI